jgi:hypothetical protein
MPLCRSTGKVQSGSKKLHLERPREGNLSAVLKAAQQDS